MVEVSYNFVLTVIHSYRGRGVAACNPTWVRLEAK